MAGYSKTPLPKKLGMKSDAVVAILNAPAGFRAALGDLPDGVVVVDDAAEFPVYDIILFFSNRKSVLVREFPRLVKRLQPAGGLWIAWPKKASGVPTDLTEDLIRNIALDAGLVDNKVCAIDDVWSGLRIVIRLQDRPKKTNTES